MSSLRDKLKKLSFFTHYPKKHETLTINNNSEEFSSKEEMWEEWFANYYSNGIWSFNEPFTILKYIGTDFNNDSSYYGNFSNSIVNWGDGTIESPNRLLHSYVENKEHTIKIINVPYTEENVFFGIDIISIEIPNNITSLGRRCFLECHNLTNILLSDSLTNLGAYCFSECVNLEHILLPDTLKIIDSFCFYNCPKLTNITIPSNVTSIGISCFRECSNLESISLSNDLTTLGSYCFYECTKLISINIPNTVTIIGSHCFEKCTNLTEIILNWTSSDKIITYNSNWITNANVQLKFIIPSGTTSLYTAKGYPSNKLEER